LVRPYIAAVANQKGGVGKTTTAVSLGAYLAAAGHRSLVVDLDAQANATSWLGFDKLRVTATSYNLLSEGGGVPRQTSQPGLDLIPSTPDLAGAEVELVSLPERETRLRRALARVIDGYDYVLIDCPPSLGLLTLNGLVAAHGVIVPVQCEYLPLEGLARLMRTIHVVRAGLNPELEVAGLVMTMHDARTRLSPQVVAQVDRHFPGALFRAVVPRSVRLAEAPSHGRTILDYAPNSPGASAYAALANELHRRLRHSRREVAA
jgi:chromosome partitioning protein